MNRSKKFKLKNSLGAFHISIAISLGLLFFSLFSIQPLPHLPLSTEPLHFSGELAFQKMVALSEDFPFRVQGHANLERSGEWIANEFRSYGYEPQTQIFEERVLDTVYTDLKNIWAEKRGRTRPDEIILISAHFDISEKTKYGAMDDASGVGVMLELAKIFAHTELDRTVLFLASNAEELGAHWGARAFITQFERLPQVKAMLSFDFVAPFDQVGITILQDGEKRGWTPLWFRQLAIDSIATIPGYRPDDLEHLLEYILRAGRHPAADHGVFLRAGIPAMNWTGYTAEFPRELVEVHHTLKDRFDVMKPASVRDFGRAAEKLIRSISELTTIPHESTEGNNFKMTRHSYLPDFFVTLLQWVIFLPFWVFCIAEFWKTPGLRSKNGSALRRELKSIFLWLSGVMLLDSLLRLFPSLHILPYFEMQPGSSKSDVTRNLNPVILITVTAFLTGFAFFLRRLDHSLGRLSTRYATTIADIKNQTLGQLGVFAILSILGLYLNPFAASLYLSFPAYLWLVMYQRINTASRRTLLGLTAAGLIPFLIVCLILAVVYHNPLVFYYLTLCSVYGLYDNSTMVVALGALVIFFRMILGLARFTKKRRRSQHG